MPEEIKDVSVVKQQSTKALAAAQQLVIDSPETMAAATDHLSKMKTVGKMIKERKEAITKPLMESLNSTRDLFKPIEASLAEAEGIVKKKMLAYGAEQDRIAEAARAKIATKVETGKMKAETAVAKMEDIKGADTKVQGKVGQVSTRTIKKYRVVDESKLPREFLIPDMGKITEALKAGQDVPGAEVYEEKVINAR